ncbi:hypothetical protein ACHAQA_005695 [Verticillium albo-atrum]
MQFQSILLALAAATAASAQAVVGTAYGFATGVTGGGSAAAAAPSSVDELVQWLSDDTPRTVVIDKEYDFTGTTATGSGCDRKSCSASNGGQLYLGDISCGSDDNVAVSSITYDVAGTKPLVIGSNKSIIGSGGKGVLKGKGIQLKSGASNVIVQGIEITDLNPGIVWGGDAIDFKGGNDGVWIDHCKVSLVGRQFVVSHYDGSRITLSNNEFDGVTTTSASCNNNHYWTMMFIGDGDQVTLDKNYLHNVAGRAPKLGQDGVTGTFQASNNLFSNMEGHAFDAYKGASAILEGNVFESVSQPMTSAGAAISTLFTVPDAAAASSCESHIGRACAINEVDSSSGDWPSLSASSALQTWSNLKEFLVEPIAAGEVAALVKSSAGPANLGSGSAVTTPVAETEEKTEEAEPVVEEPAAEEPVVETPAVEEPEAPAAEAPATGSASIAQWAQCGGNGWTGTGKCAAGTSCVIQNEWYSQCLNSAQRRKIRSLRQMA